MNQFELEVLDEIRQIIACVAHIQSSLRQAGEDLSHMRADLAEMTRMQPATR